MKLLQQNYIRHGLIMSGVLLVCLTLMHLTGQYSSFEKGGPLDIVFILSPFVIWYLGIRAKKQELEGSMTFKQGWTEGIKISTVFAVISPFIFMFYYLGFNPGILTYVSNSYGLSGVNKETVIIVDMVTQFIGAIVMGTIFSAIIAFFMKSKSK